MKRPAPSHIDLKACSQTKLAELAAYGYRCQNLQDFSGVLRCFQ
jgi:hypothetical protein